MKILNILAGAVILAAFIGIYCAVTYMRNKKIGGSGGCDGNCASCSMHTDKKSPNKNCPDEKKSGDNNNL